MTGGERLAKVAEVVCQHGYDTGWNCSCGWTGSCDEYDVHLAEALAPLLDTFRAEDEALGAARLRAVHERYFDLDGEPGVDDTTPEPEDVWRYDRDFRAALADGERGDA